jgi:hypothetical protein
VVFRSAISKDTLQGADLTYVKQNFKFSSHDFWVGKAFQIFKGNTLNDRTTNLIVSKDFKRQLP